jgi:hypothetical protein
MNIDENNNLGEDTTKQGEDGSIEKSESKELFTPPPIPPNGPPIIKDEDLEKQGEGGDKILDPPIDPPVVIETPQPTGSIAVVRNDGQNRITILSGNMRWVIEKNAQIPMTSIPTWVKQHPEFQAFRRDKILIYTNMIAQKKQF